MYFYSAAIVHNCETNSIAFDSIHKSPAHSIVNDANPLDLACHIVAPTRQQILFCVVHASRRIRDIEPSPMDASSPKPNLGVQHHVRRHNHRDCWPLNKETKTTITNIHMYNISNNGFST